jgi:hypothetical protein
MMKLLFAMFLFLYTSILSLYSEPLTIMREPYYEKEIIQGAPGKFKEIINISIDENGIISEIENTTLQYYLNKKEILISRIGNKIKAVMHDKINKDSILEIDLNDNSINYQVVFGSGFTKKGRFEKNENDPGHFKDEFYEFSFIDNKVVISQKLFSGSEKIVYQDNDLHVFYKDFDNGENIYKKKGVNLVVDEKWFGEDWETIHPETIISDYEIQNENVMVNIANYIILECFSSELADLLMPILFNKDF